MDKNLSGTLLRILLNKLTSPDKRYLVLICVFAMLLFLGYSFHYATVMTHGFAAYYGYSKLLYQGNFVPEVFDYNYFNERLQEFGFGSVKDAPLNLPTNAFALLAIATLSPLTAKAVWTILSLICYAISVKMMLRINDISPTSALGFAGISLACLWRPAYENMAYGQLYIVLLCLFCISLFGVLQKRDYLASLPVVLLLFLKGYGLLQTVWFLLNRRYKEWLILFFGVTLLALISVAIFGQEVWSAYYEKVMTKLASPSLSGQIAYQTLSSFFLHLLYFNPALPTDPLLELSLYTVQTITFIAQLIFIVFIFYCGKRAGYHQRSLTYSTLLAVTVMTAPLAEQHHYVLFLPLTYSLLSMKLSIEISRIQIDLSTVTILFSVIILAVPLPYKIFQSASFPWFLIGYLKLFAGFLLVVCSCAILYKSNNVARSTA